MTEQAPDKTPERNDVHRHGQGLVVLHIGPAIPVHREEGHLVLDTNARA